MNNTPLISIIMNCYNGEKYLQESIDSILKQSYQNWELIFWDNQSTDKSSEIFLKNKDSRFFYYLASKHTKLGNARIMATKKAKGDWLAIIDTDDLWSPNKLEKQIKAINETKLPIDSIGLVYSRTMGIDENSLITQELCHSDLLDTKMPEGMILYDLLFKGNFIISASILLNKKIFLSVGGFPEEFVHASDYYISCAISSKANIICVNEYLTKYRIHTNNRSLKEKVISFEEQLKIFNTWSKYVDSSFKKKKQKIKHLNTMLGLMMIKYKYQIIRGSLRILIKGSIFFAIKNLFLELIKLSKKIYANK